MALGLVALLAFLNRSGGGSAPPPASKTVLVPDVIGLSRGDAEAAVRDAGLEIGDVLATEDEHGVVVRTDPPSGSRVAPGSAVTLYLGSSPKKGKGGDEGHGNGNAGPGTGDGGGGD